MFSARIGLMRSGTFFLHSRSSRERRIEDLIIS